MAKQRSILTVLPIGAALVVSGALASAMASRPPGSKSLPPSGKPLPGAFKPGPKKAQPLRTTLDDQRLVPREVRTRLGHRVGSADYRSFVKERAAKFRLGRVKVPIEIDTAQIVDLGAPSPFAVNTATWIDLERNPRLAHLLRRDLKISTPAASKRRGARKREAPKVTAFLMNHFELDERALKNRSPAKYRENDELMVSVVYSGRALLWARRSGAWKKLSDRRFKTNRKARTRDVQRALAKFEPPKQDTYYEGYRMANFKKSSRGTYAPNPATHIEDLPVYHCTDAHTCSMLKGSALRKETTKLGATLAKQLASKSKKLASTSGCLHAAPDGRVILRATKAACLKKVASISSSTTASGTCTEQSTKDSSECSLEGGFSAGSFGDLVVDCGEGCTTPLSDYEPPAGLSGTSGSSDTSGSPHSPPNDSPDYMNSGGVGNEGTTAPANPASEGSGTSPQPPAPKTNYRSYGSSSYPGGAICNRHCNVGTCHVCCGTAAVAATTLVDVHAGACYAVAWIWPPALAGCAIAQAAGHMAVTHESTMCVAQCAFGDDVHKSNNPHSCQLTQ